MEKFLQGIGIFIVELLHIVTDVVCMLICQPRFLWRGAISNVLIRFENIRSLLK